MNGRKITSVTMARITKICNNHLLITSVDKFLLKNLAETCNISK